MQDQYAEQRNCFPASHGAFCHSSMHSQVPVSAVENTLGPMEGVIFGGTQATLPLCLTALEAKISETHYDAIAISETFVNHSRPDSHLQLGAFDLHRHDRSRKEGGGDALYIRKQWKLLHIHRSPQIPGRFEKDPKYLICESFRP